MIGCHVFYWTLLYCMATCCWHDACKFVIYCIFQWQQTHSSSDMLLLCIQEMAQRQRVKMRPSENTPNDDDDRPRSILKPVPSVNVAIASPRPEFAHGLYDWTWIYTARSHKQMSHALNTMVPTLLCEQNCLYMLSEAGIADCRVSECDRKTVPSCGTRNRKCSTAELPNYTSNLQHIIKCILLMDVSVLL